MGCLSMFCYTETVLHGVPFVYPELKCVRQIYRGFRGLNSDTLLLSLLRFISTQLQHIQLNWYSLYHYRKHLKCLLALMPDKRGYIWNAIDEKTERGRKWKKDGGVHLGKGGRWDGEPRPGEGRWSGDWLGDMCGLNSPVCRRQSSSSFVRLSRFFSLLSFSTYSCRLAFSSDSCLRKREKWLAWCKLHPRW